MLKKNKQILEITIVIMGVIFLGLIIFNLTTKTYIETISREYQSTYVSDPVSILLVSGHDHYSYGGKFRELKEEQLTRELAAEIFYLLNQDNRFRVITTRDFATGDYTSSFATYFASSEAQIVLFRQEVKEAMKNLLKAGTILQVEPIIKHNPVMADTSFRLYGINKWANDHDIDLVLHLHFNDYPRADMTAFGKYTGFSLYVPEKQLPHSSQSKQVAEALYSRLQTVSATSTFPLEAGGIIEAQDLIAVGSCGCQTHPAVLVEYGYIYEPKYYLESRRQKSLPLLARATYRALVDYFY